ncbi:MAG: PQQ-binding-like beta-propeller repeat protein [Bauldia sp.]
MSRSVLSLVAATAAVATATALPALAAPATFDRLLNADKEPQNWLMAQQNYSGWRHSGLDQINRGNVANLKLAFIASIGGRSTGGTLAGREEATPLVNDGIMYVTDSWARVMAFNVGDATKGAVPLWRFDPKITKSRTQRGVAQLNDTVYIGTNDTRIVALNRNTGEVLFDKQAAAPPDPQWGTPSAKTQGFTSAPVTLRTKGGKELVLQGESTGGQSGTISWVGAWDAKTGELAWRFFTVPKPGEPGSETWKDNHNAWKIGGAGVWSIGSFDPDLNIVVNGTGDAFPTSQPEFRPGDNLYAASVIANDVDTGKLTWYFQETPNEQWDFDSPNTKLLVTVNGRKQVAEFARNGFFYQLDRGTGAFIRADQYTTEVNWTKGIDPKTGKPVDYDPAGGVQAYAGLGSRNAKPGQRTCPGTRGPGFYPPTYDPDLAKVFAAGAETCSLGTRITTPMDPAKNWVAQNTCCTETANPGGKVGQGPNQGVKATIWAFDLTKGSTARAWIAETPNESGLLGTKSGLLFTGEHDGSFSAYDKGDLKRLWTFRLGAGICAPPISYAVNSRQYVAVVAGCSANTDASALVQPSAFIAFFAL